MLPKRLANMLKIICEATGDNCRFQGLAMADSQSEIDVAKWFVSTVSSRIGNPLDR